MSLLRKFAILLGLLASTITVGLGAALLFGVVLEREVSAPLREATGALTNLAGFKRAIVRVDSLMLENGPSEELGPALDEIQQHAAIAAYNTDLHAVIGPLSVEALVHRTQGASFLVRTWIETRLPDDGARAHGSLLAAREFVDAVEERVLADTIGSVEFGEEMRRLHYVTLFGGLLTFVLFGLLTILLLRRWVLRPVSVLDDAARRIGAGDFEHRVAIPGNDELATLGRQINAMAASIATLQAEAVDRERLAAVGEMVRRLAHNLRNPLAGIRNLAEISRMDSPEGGQVRELQGEIIAAVDRFNEWLRGLLDVTSPLRVSPAEHAPGPWLEGIVASHAPMARMRSVELRHDLAAAPEVAEFDPRHLEHAVVAVLTNAIQVSPPGAPVTLAARATGRDLPSGWWEIEVADEGPGIPANLRERIFRPYFTTKRDGNGIGLAIAMQVVKRHGGRIDLSTRENAGTRFFLRLPLKTPPESEPSTG